MKYLKDYEYILNEAKFDIADDDLEIDVDATFDEMSKYPAYFNELLDAVKDNNYTDFVGVILEQMDSNEKFDKEKLGLLKSYINNALSGQAELIKNYAAFISQLIESIEDWKELYKGKNFADIHETDVKETIPELFGYIKKVAKDGIISFKEYKRMAAIISAEDMCIDNMILSEYAQKHNLQEYLDIFINGMKGFINNFSQDNSKAKVLIKKLNLMINVPNNKITRAVASKKSGSSKSGGNKLLTKFGFPTAKHTGTMVFSWEGEKHEIDVTNLSANEVANEIAKVIGFDIFASYANPKIFTVEGGNKVVGTKPEVNNARKYGNFITILSEAGVDDEDIYWISDED